MSEYYLDYPTCKECANRDEKGRCLLSGGLDLEPDFIDENTLSCDYFEEKEVEN